MPVIKFSCQTFHLDYILSYWSTFRLFSSNALNPWFCPQLLYQRYKSKTCWMFSYEQRFWILMRPVVALGAQIHLFARLQRGYSKEFWLGAGDGKPDVCRVNREQVGCRWKGSVVQLATGDRPWWEICAVVQPLKTTSLSPLGHTLWRSVGYSVRHLCTAA